MTNQNNAAQAADKLPHWEEISAKLSRSETLTPLELFIHENEPGGDAAAPWRDQLDAALASAPVAGEVVGWAAVPSRGKRAGRIYCTCDTREQIDAYIEQVHQSNDSLTLWARPVSFADAAPQASAESTHKPVMSVAEFCAEAGRLGLTADTLAAQLSQRPEFADCLPQADKDGGQQHASLPAQPGAQK